MSRFRPAVRHWYRRVWGFCARWQDPCTVAGLFVLGTLVYLAGLRSLTGTDDVALAARLALLAGACAGLLLRRRHPLVALGIALAALAVDIWWGVSLPMFLVVFDALFNTTLYGSRRVTRALVGLIAAAALAAAVTVFVLLRDWRAVFLLTLQATLIIVVPVWWATDVRQQREVAAAERFRAEQVTKIAELDRRAAVAAERNRLARDLHDVVAGHLSAIALQSEAVLSMVDGDPDTVRTVMRSVRENSIQSLAEMRAMIDLLRSDGDDQPDPTTAPARLRDIDPLLESARAGGLRVEARIGDDSLPVAVDVAAYRIVQEALTNVVKHAPGACTDVEVTRENGKLVVEVANEMARTMAHDLERPGTGLTSMRERAEVLGGSVSAGPSGRRWLVRAELPLNGALT